MARTKDETIREQTTAYLAQIDPKNIPSPADIQAGIIDSVAASFEIINQTMPKGRHWHIPDKLAPAQIADILLTLHPVANIAYGGLMADKEYDVLCLYQDKGRDEGIYISGRDVFHKLIHQYAYTLSEKETDEVISIVQTNAPRRERTLDRNLIAVNNGIFDYDTKQLLPFDKSMVFTSKSRVDYTPNAVNPVIHNPDDGTDWDIESWMDDLFEEPELRQLIWEIIGAIIRPNVPWGKSAWFYSNTGNNGKGTLCELMRQITGENTFASIPIADFGKDFMLEPLVRASAIIVDENDVGTFIDKAANLKAIITNDVIQMNRKFKTPIAFQFRGFMVQCLNELPKIKDRSDSLYRRQLFIPFTKCFTGQERKYIKYDYLHRKDVLEYVLCKVLNTSYYKLSEPEICKITLEEYKEYNDPIRQFIEEILPETVWDLLPYAFLYDLYKAWFKDVSPTGTAVGRNTFINDLNKAVTEGNEWMPQASGSGIRPGSRMDKAEPLIAQYNLTAWMNPLYKGNDTDKKCHPWLKDHYKGLLRVPQSGKTSIQQADTDDTQ